MSFCFFVVLLFLLAIISIYFSMFMCYTQEMLREDSKQMPWFGSQYWSYSGKYSTIFLQYNLLFHHWKCRKLSRSVPGSDRDRVVAFTRHFLLEQDSACRLRFLDLLSIDFANRIALRLSSEDSNLDTHTINVYLYGNSFPTHIAMISLKWIVQYLLRRPSR